MEPSLSTDPITKNFTSYKIPNWYSRNLPAGTSWSWDLKFDNSRDNIWFTDEKLNSVWKFNIPDKQFEQFIIPFHSLSYSTSYPISLAFENSNDVYLVGIRSLSLWHGSIDEMRNGTTAGIENIPIPFNNLFKGIPDYEVGLGSLAIDYKKKDVWITALAFEKKGALVKYSIPEKKFDIFELPETIKSPTGISVDSAGNLWITDHATSSFYKISPPSNSSAINSSDVDHIVTSPLSSRIIGTNFTDTKNNTLNLYQDTLPYWIKAAHDSNVYINEHVGNKIAKSSPNDGTLIEYWIPSQNVLYSVCNQNTKLDECGYSNALQFDLQPQAINATENLYSGLWFTEQSENKIGFLDLDKVLPLRLSVDPTVLNFHNGINKTMNINLTITANMSTLIEESKDQPILENKFPLKPIVSSTFGPNGDLQGIKARFDPNLYELNVNQNIVKSEVNETFKLELNTTKEIKPGVYSLMVGVESKDFTILKKVSLNVIN